jgi:hypothetical protein
MGIYSKCQLLFSKIKIMKMNNIIKYILLMMLLIFIYSLIGRKPHIDDAWLGEHAYWQSKLGYVKSELMHGITQQEVYLLCHHKLLTLQGASFITILGFSIFSLKTVSLFYFVFFLLLFYFFTCNKIFNKNQFYLSVLLLVSNTLIFEYSFVFRPEIPIMTLGFISYIFLNNVLNNCKRSYMFTILGGLFAGLCVSTHLNGIIFPIAGFILLVWNRKYIQSIVFGLSAIPAILIYFYDFTSKFNFNFWLYQINESPMLERTSDLPFGVSILVKLFNEHMRFFHSPSEISFSVLLIVSLIISLRYLKAYKNLIRYAFLLILLLPVFSVHISTKYMIIYLPYLIILVTLSLNIIFDKNNSDKIIFGKLSFKKARPYIFIFTLIYVLINTALDIHLSKDKWTSNYNKNIVQSYIKAKPEECRIVAPMTFIFNEITRFKSIQSELCYSEMQKSDKSIFKQGFLNRTKSFNIDYIILSYGFIEKFGMDRISDKEISDNNFQLLYRSQSLMILENLGSPVVSGNLKKKPQNIQ